jgi:VanZ family protein
MGLIYYFSSRSVLPAPIAEPAPDGETYRQLIHMFEYTVLTGFLYRALAMRRSALRAQASNLARLRRRWPIVVAMALAALYAVSDELHQSFVPNRDPSLRDVFTDLAGIALALAAIALVSLLAKRRRGQPARGGVTIVLVLPRRSRGMPTR